MTSLTDSTLICSKKIQARKSSYFYTWILVHRELSNCHIDLSDFSSAAPPSYAMHKNYTVYHFPLAAFKFHFYLSFLPYLHFAPSGGHKYVLEQPFCYTDTAVWVRHTPYFLSMRKSFQPRSSLQYIQQFLS